MHPPRDPNNLLKLYKEVKSLFKSIDFKDPQILSASPPSVFVGRVGYPYVNVGILSPVRDVPNPELYDAPSTWSNKNYSINQIISLRASLVNSRFKAQVKASSKFLDISQEVGMASKPVDLEIDLKRKPNFNMQFGKIALPMGPSAEIKSVELTGNPKIHTKVDKVNSDTDLKASEALDYLYKNNFEVDFLSKILSIGSIGLKTNRKLVPTKWSITATDDIVGKYLIKEVKKHNILNDYWIFFDNYLGNYYFILLFPEVFSYELFEAYMPLNLQNQNSKLQTAHDFEFYSGRKDYADDTVGGYYACRLAVLEKLKILRKQATALVFRFVTNEYSTPLGVWVCRQTTRKALEKQGLKFESKELMLKYLKNLVLDKFNYNIENLLKEANLLKNINQQTKLTSF